MISFRYSIDKVFMRIFPPDWYKPDYQRRYQRMVYLDDWKRTMEWRFDKFSKIEGHIRTNFFSDDSKNFYYCFYYPIMEFNNKIICWILFDIKTLKAMAYFNINEGFMDLVKIKPPKIKITDTNYIPVHPVKVNEDGEEIEIEFEFSDIIKTLYKYVDLVMEYYFQLVHRFNVYEQGLIGKIERKFSSVEVCKEAIGANCWMLNLNECRQKKMVVVKSENQTVYFNSMVASYKHQFKIYEKTPTLLRLEHTFNNVRGYMRDQYEFQLFLMQLIRKNENHYNLHNLFSEVKNYTSQETFEMWFKGVKGKGELTRAEFCYLLSNDSYRFNRSTQNLRRRLTSKKLIVSSGVRGIYYPSEKLEQAKRVLNKHMHIFESSFHIQQREKENRLLRGLDIDE